MIKKILFIGDFYRGDQDRNVKVLYYLISPVFKTFNLEIKIYDDTEHLTNYDKWVESLNGKGESFLTNYDLTDTVVIAFEMNPLDKKFLNIHRIPWLDMEIHPIRFLDDLYFSISSSIDFDFDTISISDNSIQLHANFSQISNIDRDYNLHDNSLLIIGQEPQDKSVFFDNRFKTLVDYISEIDSLSKQYDNIYYRPHPFKSNKNINEIIIEKYNATLLSDMNYYDLISSKSIKAVCGISSSTLHEAKFFDKNVVFLEKKVKLFSKPIRLDKFLSCRDFWNRILPGINNMIDFYLPENKCRNFFSYWSFETPVTKLNKEIKALEIKAIQAEEKAIQAEEKAIQAEEKATLVIDNYYAIINSNSWKITKPLRQLKFRISEVKNISIVKLRTMINSNSILKNIVLKIIPSRYIHKYSYHKNNIENFKSFICNKTIIHFSLSPLEDQRGIGRVTKEQINYLEKNCKIYSKQFFSKEIYFYSSIHWCPSKLRNNTVIMIHDVTPMVLSELFPEENRTWNEKFKPIAQQASKIITISNNSKNDINKFLDIPLDKIIVVNNGVTSLPITTYSKEQLPKNYFVYLGAYDKHKNLDIVFKALTQKRCSDFHLVLIGNNFQSKEKVKQMKLEERVHFLGMLSDAEVGFVIQRAIALLFPSLYEGFGLPPMEAGLLKTPSICSNRPTMTEFLEDCVLFADAFDENEWVEQMLKMSNHKIRNKFSSLVYNRVREFTWNKSCENLISSIQK